MNLEQTTPDNIEYVYDDNLYIDMKDFCRWLNNLDINITYQELCNYLIENDIFESENVPTKEYFEEDYFVIATIKTIHQYGESIETNVPLITPKGQINLTMDLKIYTDNLKRR